MYLNIYYIVVALITLFLAVIWVKENWFNIILKMGFYAISGWSAINALKFFNII